MHQLPGWIGGFIALVIMLFLTFLLSFNYRNYKNFPFRTVVSGGILQIAILFFLLKVPIVEDFFEFLSRAFIKVISFADYGIEFLLRSFNTGRIESPLVNFAFKVLPTIVFFSALMSVLYYLRIIPYVVYFFGMVMRRVMKASGIESLVAAGNIFVGQTEAPLLVRPYLKYATKSEILCIMVSGMATIAGGVMASYVNFLGGDSIEEKILIAKHLMGASILSAPAAIVAAKILLPESETPITTVKVPEIKSGANIFDAIANGTYDGIRLAVNVAGMLLTFTAFIYLINYILSFTGNITGLNEIIRQYTPYKELSMQMILGYLGAPIVWIIGIPTKDVLYVGQLLGEKTILNEFYAYVTLGQMKSQNLLSKESVIIATYILCGFSNFASIGIQIGGIGTLVPEKKVLLSTLGIKALIGGTMACLYTACVVRMFI